MKRISFNDDWEYMSDAMSNSIHVNLPFDAQISAARSKNAAGGSGHGYFEGGIYTYKKKFTVPEEWKNKHIELIFEGVYKNAVVTLNGKQLVEHKYGYTPFSASLDDRIYIGKENEFVVIADNSKLPNSRWYTGGGIYRPVFLQIGDKKGYINNNGLTIRTESINPPTIHVETKSSIENAVVSIEIMDENKVVATGFGSSVDIVIENASLWSAENPKLYKAIAKLSVDGQVVDEAESKFGIRELKYSTKGLFINGKETLLRGGCIHHDNGLLGAATFDESEDRRVRIMKENGFNAIRMSHNPASRALLEACDRHGMYLMDEAFDMWFNRKNPFDYGVDFDTCWTEDVTAMVKQDYNHPSVIMYSVGNELAEPITEKGRGIADEMIGLIHKLDDSRPVTCGVNLMVMGRAAKGNGIYNDGEQNTGAKEQSTAEDNGEVKNGSLIFNMMASFIGPNMNKGGNSKKVDALTSPFCNKLDIVGYNYGSGRYPLDATAHPNRIIVGSETFPHDICKNWKMVKKYPYLIGDFMWTAWDYIGEAGIGAWSYTGGMAFNRPYPWLLAGAGVIDILGNPDMSCKYAGVVWDKIDKPVIGVKPVNHPGVRVSKSTWRGTNAIESWSWSGCEGNKAEVEVYSKADSVELFFNGNSLGKKKLKDCRAIFKTKYQAGTLTAIDYNADGTQKSQSQLVSATGDFSVKITPEKNRYQPGDIAYIDIAIVGENDVVESNADRLLKCKANGCELLGFGSANPCTKESYVTGEFSTYQGKCQAVVRITSDKPGIIIEDGSKAYNCNLI